MVTSAAAGKTLSNLYETPSAMFFILQLASSMSQYLQLGDAVNGLGRILTLIVPMYGSTRVDGVRGRLPHDDPDRDLDGGIRGDSDRWSQWETGRLRSMWLERPGVILPPGLRRESEELRRMYGGDDWGEVMR